MTEQYAAQQPDKLIDLRASVPDLTPYLLKGERVINIVQMGHSEKDDETPPSPLHELYRLAGARLVESAVEFSRPVYASTAKSETSDSEHLHLYETLFGRDSLRVAVDILPLYPQLTRVTLLELAKLQGQTSNTQREEERGKIIHEARDPESPIGKRLTEEHGWQWPYYGSIDATPSFISTLVLYIKSTGDREFLDAPFITAHGEHRVMKEAFDDAVEWLLGSLEESDIGCLEFKPGFDGSITNQAWKDSPDSYFHADGSIANHASGISSIEVQALAFDALKDAAELYEAIEDTRLTDRLSAAATRLETSVMDLFWTEDHGGYFVLGLDRDDGGRPRQLKIRTSNMGHVLHSQLLMGNDPVKHHRIDMTVRQLFSTELLTPSGIRTLASNEVRYRPRAYHNGSVWPWDTYVIARGLQLHGYYGLANELIERTHNVIQTTGMYPEYVTGDDSDIPFCATRVIDIWDPALGSINRLEQPPQQVQAWSVAAMVAIEHARPTTPTHALDEYKRRFEDEILSDLRRAA